MGAPTNAANVKKVLANSEPSTQGGKAAAPDRAAVIDPTRQYGTDNCRIARSLL